MLRQSDASAEELRDLGKFGDTTRITPKGEVTWPYVPSKTDYIRHGEDISSGDEGIFARILENSREEVSDVFQ